MMIEHFFGVREFFFGVLEIFNILINGYFW